MCDARVDLIKPRNFDFQEEKPMHLILKNISKTNLIYGRPEVARDRGGIDVGGVSENPDGFPQTRKRESSVNTFKCSSKAEGD
jgi:hypothetical protein